MRLPGTPPASASSLTSALTCQQRGRIFEARSERVYGGFTRNPDPWPLPLPDSTPEKPIFYPGQRAFKFGGCPEHRNRSLTPEVVKDSLQWNGTVRLFCTAVKEKTPSGFRKCLCSFPYKTKDLRRLPLDVQQEFKALPASFARGSSDT